MNCVASSFAAFIVGGVVGVFFAVAVAVLVVSAASSAHAIWRRKRKPLAEQIIDAAVEMVLDDDVVEYVGDDVSDDVVEDAPIEKYGVPADRWEALVKMSEAAGEIE